MSTVTLYGRAGCHLCDDALAVIERLRARIAFDFEPCDIETDAALFSRYLERIPVVTVDGVEVCELFVDERQLEGALTNCRDHPRPQ
ncbi:MAG: glutaredoxin family protein [Actinomycetota bacterium]|nr:glutaredoxin family protein [Actinomycetota bacterium]